MTEGEAVKAVLAYIHVKLDRADSREGAGTDLAEVDTDEVRDWLDEIAMWYP